MKILRSVLFLLLLGAAIAVCWKYHTAEMPMHAEDGYLSAEQAGMQLDAMGISVDEYAAKQLKAAEEGDAELLRILVAAQPGNIVQEEKTLNTTLHLGARAGHLAVCELLTTQHHAVDRTNKMGKTPLHMAAEAGHADCVKLLITKGARINKYDVNGYTPLLYAVEAGHTACAEILLQAGASRLARTAEGKTLEQLAKAHPEIEALLAKSSKAPQQTITEDTKEDTSTILLPTADLFSGAPLAEAIRQKNSEQVAQLIQEGLDVNYKEHDKTPLVILAVQTQQAEVLEQLLAAGANPEAAASNGDKALHVATTNGDTEALKILINHRADVNSKANGTGALVKAVLDAQKACAELLLQAGANANEVTANGDTPLIYAIKAGNTAMAELLLAHGANANANHHDKTPLGIAAEEGQVACVELLLKAGANATYMPKHKRTALHLAANNNAAACIPLLIQAKADANAQDQNLDTPLHYAACKGYTESLQALLENGANADTRNSRQYAAIHLVAEKGEDACIPHLKHAGADINASLPNGYTPLHLAVREGHAPCVTALIAAGANIHAATPEGDTPLSLARKHHKSTCIKTLAASILTEKGLTTFDNAALVKNIKEQDYETLRMLLEAGASPDEDTLHMVAALPDSSALALLLETSNKVNRTAEPLLHTAAKAGSAACIKTLLRYNADPDAKNKKGETAFVVAKNDECKTILEAAQKLKDRGYTARNYNDGLIAMAEKGDHINLSRLIDVGADINYTNANGNTPLHAAASIKIVTCARKLLAAGANPNVINREKKTPLMLAVKYGFIPTVRALISNGADINAVVGNDSAATEAIHNGQIECLQVLLDAGVDVNSGDTQQRTLLYFAVLEKNGRIMKTLIERGADPNSVYADEPLLFTVVKTKSTELLQLFLTCRDLNINCLNQSGESAAHIAAQQDHAMGLALLIQAGLRTDSRDSQGQTIAHYAAFRGHANLLQLMINAGISVRVPDSRGRTPLYYAGQNEQHECVQILEMVTGEKYEDIKEQE